MRQAASKFKDDFDAHYALGAELYRLGRDTEAIESLERARLINDRDAPVYYLFGLVMARQQKFAVSEYAFSRLPFVFDSSNAIFALALSLAVNIAFSLLASARAARLDPIGALKYE